MSHYEHKFIFHPGLWIGEGKVTFSASPDHIRFYTKWRIEHGVEGVIACWQQVEIQGTDEHVFNNFRMMNITPQGFDIELENELMGKIHGKGLVDEKTVAWEFRGGPEFEGFEVYELQEDGDYMVHAEYASPDQYRTIIDGRIWKKTG